MTIRAKFSRHEVASRPRRPRKLRPTRCSSGLSPSRDFLGIWCSWQFLRAEIVAKKSGARGDAVRNRSRKIAACEWCGQTRSIRADSNATHCRSCNARKAAKPGVPRPNRVLGKETKCEFCRKAYYRHKSEYSRKFCSASCANESKRVHSVQTKSCKQCGTDFEFSDKPSSNSAGVYCSLKCRNISYLGMRHGKPARNTKTHRPGWASISRRFRKFNDFCSCCGQMQKRLAVHHVDPYWRSKNNETSNLVTLCPKCHGRLETLSEKIAVLPAIQRQIAVAFIQSELNDLWHLHRGRRILSECG